jgi:hypothetical protein
VKEQLRLAAGRPLRYDPTVRRLRGKMTATLPRSVWLSFSFTADHTPYRLTFPHTAATVTLWMAGLYQPWEALATWELADFATGDDVLTAVKAVIRDPALDVLHRWRGGSSQTNAPPGALPRRAGTPGGAFGMRPGGDNADSWGCLGRRFAEPPRARRGRLWGD